MDGHYIAVTAQNATIEFDITDNGAAISGFNFEEIDSTCEPGNVERAFFWNGQSRPLDGSGRIDVTLRYTYTNGGGGSLRFVGAIETADRASGTLSQSETYTSGAGVTYSCNANTTWAGGSGASAAQPAQHALPGHYVGTTSQGAALQFDIVPDTVGRLMKNFSFDELDGTCDPELSVTSTGGRFQDMFVDAVGHQHSVFTQPDLVLTIDSTVDTKGHVSGTVLATMTYVEAGTTYACTTGLLTWTANLS
jgi:hypothetical protein